MPSDELDEALLGALSALRQDLDGPGPARVQHVRAAAAHHASRRRPARRLGRAGGRFLAGALAGSLAVGGVAFAAQGSGPGSLLYPVKLAGESVRGWLAFSDTGDAEYHLWRAETRIEELVAELGGGDLAGALAAGARAEGELVATQRLLSALDPQAVEALADRAGAMALQLHRLRAGLIEISDPGQA